MTDDARALQGSDYLQRLCEGLDDDVKLVIANGLAARLDKAALETPEKDIELALTMAVNAMVHRDVTLMGEVVAVLQAIPERIAAEREKARKDRRSAVESERIACAKLADEWQSLGMVIEKDIGRREAAASIAASIRARQFSRERAENIGSSRPVDPAEVDARR